MGASDPKRREKLDEILRGAELLIEYASRNALKSEGVAEQELSPVILRVAKVRAALEAGTLTSEDEGQFFCDYRLLSRAFLPVTVGSIRDSLPDDTGRCRKYVWWGHPIAPAAAAVRRLSICSLIALFLLLIFQIIWLVGFDLSDRVRALEKEEVLATAAVKLAQASEAARQAGERVEVTETGASTTQKELGDLEAGTANKDDKAVAEATRAAQGASAAWHAAKLELTGAKAAERRLLEDQYYREGQRKLLTGMLTRWTYIFRWDHLFGGGDASDDGTDPKKAEPRKTALGSQQTLEETQDDHDTVILVAITVTILQTYFLPLLYGFLGTCAYVLRQLTIETRARTFRSEIEIGYWLRISLGVLAGLAVGWFLRPDPDTDGLIQGLTPFALSFLAGYSVEVLFAGMDRLVSAFGSSTESVKS